MSDKNNEKDRVKMLQALATVSSLAMMIVMDFVLAYLGGDWLDDYFATGDHTFRVACICLAIVTVFLTFYKLICAVISDKD